MAAQPLSLWGLFILFYSGNIAQHNPGSAASILEGVMKGLVELIKGPWLMASATVWFFSARCEKSYNQKRIIIRRKFYCHSLLETAYSDSAVVETVASLQQAS